MYKIGIVFIWHSMADSDTDTDTIGSWIEFSFFVCLVEAYTWRGREVPIGRQGGR